MAYTTELASKLTGATDSQLRRFRERAVLVPEYQDGREYLYSFRDIVALRSLMWLRGTFSLQSIRRVIDNLDLTNLTLEHLSEVKFAKSGRTILAMEDDGYTDLLRHPGNRELTEFTLGDIFGAFKTWNDRDVPDLRRPREHLSVDPERMGGIPVISGTRIPYDTIARLVDYETIYPKDVTHYYPQVSAEAVRDAIDFSESTPGRKRVTA